LCGEVGDVGNHDAENDFDGAVVEIPLDLLNDDGDNQADGHADADEISQAKETFSKRGSLAADHHGNAEFQSEQAGGIIDQAFAFEDVDDALR
jgi:hypothetical protein